MRLPRTPLEHVMFDFPCDFCGARRGEWCRIVRSPVPGRLHTHLHNARRLRAIEAGRLPSDEKIDAIVDAFIARCGSRDLIEVTRNDRE